MSEGKQQNWFVPLRVRFRSSAERAQWEREQAAGMPVIPDTADDLALQIPAITYPHSIESPRRARQIKELIRLGNVLRAEMGLDEVLQRIVTVISACTGFRIAVINLLEEKHDYLAPVAFAGATEEGRRIVREHPVTVEQMMRFMRPEFKISQSYFISHEHAGAFADIVGGIDKTLDDYEPGGWHPEDALIVPLFSLRMKKILGFLSLDDPADGKIPSEENIEIIELFANQAAIAIDNARFFKEREAERLALEEAIVALRLDLEQVQRGDLRVRLHSSHEKLQPVIEAVNVMVGEISEILGSVQKVTQAVDEHAQDVRRSSDVLARDTSQQERQVEHISSVADDMAGTIKRVSEQAEKLSIAASETTEVTRGGQQQIARANDGMRFVRETTMQSARVIKRLGESGQEINDTVVELTDLTTRMNLLALNAAIEAVRAGEQGQGFVVIAQEIRSLAVSSAEAARKVALRIRAIQNEITTVSQSIDQNIQHVVTQSELVMQTGIALDAIGVVTEQMVELVQGLEPAAESQAQGSQVVRHSVEEIARMATEIAGQSGNMKQSLAHLVELTNSLRSRLAVFRIAEG
ncbi:MAG TPA: methyl-accepting chemotaxis protein [Ktedonobacteraceae bacterium]|nr:methyl-accepting chemotaxis protein [Ktedonobacteraceae bacterium]